MRPMKRSTFLKTAAGLALGTTLNDRAGVRGSG